MIITESLGYEEASRAIEAGIAAARRFGRPMAFAVADPSGTLIASARTGCSARARGGASAAQGRHLGGNGAQHAHPEARSRRPRQYHVGLG